MATSEAIQRDQSVRLDISCAKDPSDTEGCIPVCISIRPPAGMERTPLDICCVIDISWSMSMEATVQSSSGVVERNGLSLMDIAKHAVRTIIKTLGAHDRLSVVTFAGDARIVFPLTAMDVDGKNRADDAVESIGFDSDTFLWNGLSKGLETLQVKHEHRLSSLLLLTDGETKERASIMDNLREYKAKNEGLPCSIYSFGIGYEIDSELLVQVSSFADGSYAFIPDAGFVGTIFVNTISNLMVSMGKNALLTIEADGGAAIKAVQGGWESEVSSDGIWRLSLGNLQYDQSKDVVLKVTMPSGTDTKDVGTYLAASLEYTIRHERPDARVRCQAEGNGSKVSDAESTAAVESQRCRARFVDALAEASRKAKEGSKEALQGAELVVQAAAEDIKASSQASATSVQALLEDALGQSREGLSREDWYKKWGRHYLPSIMLAHKLQQCNNFKDPGVQDYGGTLFRSLRDDADEAFCTLAAPKPTPSQWRYLGGGQLVTNPDYVRPSYSTSHNFSASGHEAYRPSAAPSAPAISMAAYHDASGG